MNPAIKDFLVTVVSQAEFWQLCVALLAAVGGPIWGAFKLWAARKAGKYREAYKILEAAVEEVYVNSVRELKKKKGKLSKTDIYSVRQEAIDTAVRIGKQRGLDVMATLGKEYLPMLIARIVTNNKPYGG